MSKDMYAFSNWSDEDIQQRIKLYENEKGRLDLAKLNTSKFTDVVSIAALIICIAIFLIAFLVFSLMGQLWTDDHILALSYFQSYPFIALVFMGAYSILHRCSEIRRYYAFKQTLRARHG